LASNPISSLFALPLVGVDFREACIISSWSVMAAFFEDGLTKMVKIISSDTEEQIQVELSDSISIQENLI